jgi:molecular chaperone GrpE
MAETPQQAGGPQMTDGTEHGANAKAPGQVTAEQAERNRAEIAERQRDEYFALLRQAQADYENAHQRNRREREQEQKYRSEKLAMDLLTALDNLERALGAAREAGEKSPLVQGVSLVYDQLLDALKRHGITRIEALGQPFDPNLHQAVTQIASTEYPPNSVVQVLEPGYRIHDRLLRVAKVIISQPT